MPSFELTDHDADLGLAMEGGSYEEVLAAATAALTSCVIAPDSVRLREIRRVEATGDSPEEMLVRWLKGWLGLYVAEGFLVGETTRVEVAGNRVVGEARGEILDPERHRVRREVKAVTYHQARVESKDGRWRGWVILDV